jgi:hypothetical protein
MLGLVVPPTCLPPLDELVEGRRESRHKSAIRAHLTANASAQRSCPANPSSPPCASAEPKSLAF